MMIPTTWMTGRARSLLPSNSLWRGSWTRASWLAGTLPTVLQESLRCTTCMWTGSWRRRWGPQTRRELWWREWIVQRWVIRPDNSLSNSISLSSPIASVWDLSLSTEEPPGTPPVRWLLARTLPWGPPVSRPATSPPPLQWSPGYPATLTSSTRSVGR